MFFPFLLLLGPFSPPPLSQSPPRVSPVSRPDPRRVLKHLVSMFENCALINRNHPHHALFWRCLCLRFVVWTKNSAEVHGNLYRFALFFKAARATRRRRREHLALSTVHSKLYGGDSRRWWRGGEGCQAQRDWEGLHSLCVCKLIVHFAEERRAN